MRKLLSVFISLLFFVNLSLSPYLYDRAWAAGWRVGQDSFGDITEDIPDTSLGDILLWLGICVGVGLFIDFIIHHHKSKKDHHNTKEDVEEDIKVEKFTKNFLLKRNNIYYIETDNPGSLYNDQFGEQYPPVFLFKINLKKW